MAKVITLWEKITSAPDPLLKFKKGDDQKACIYPNPYDGKSEVVRWFFSRNNHCEVFFACSKEVSDIIESDGWAEVGYEFTLYVEGELMNYCIENTDWQKCVRYGYEYDEKIPKDKLDAGEYEFGCGGTNCHCEPFGTGDFTNGIAEEKEFNL